MVFATRAALFANRRLVNMPSKYGNLQYYKGKGSTSEGRLTSKGKFIPDWTKLKFIMSPGSLQGFPLQPYVAKAPRRKPAKATTATTTEAKPIST